MSLDQRKVGRTVAGSRHDAAGPPGPGAPWWGVQRGLCCFGPLPAGGLAVERCLKEGVSRCGQRAGCPLTNPRGLQKRAVSPQRSAPQSGRPLLTTVPHGSASGGKGLPP